MGNRAVQDLPGHLIYFPAPGRINLWIFKQNGVQNLHLHLPLIAKRAGEYSLKEWRNLCSEF